MNRIWKWMAVALTGVFLAACQSAPQTALTPSSPAKMASVDETVGRVPAAPVPTSPNPTATPTDIPPTPTSGPPAPTTNFGPAPEIDTEVWLNTDVPLRLADLRGKVVLVEFWTYG